jgi:uncharacterized protein
MRARTGLPLHVSASQALAREQRFTAELGLDTLPRLRAAVAGEDGEIRVNLQLRRDDAGAAWLKGEVDVRLQLVCRRCLDVFAWQCAATVSLRLVFSEDEERRLLGECEPYLVLGDRLCVREAVEDEVLLGLPLAPACNRPGCTERTAT